MSKLILLISLLLLGSCFQKLSKQENIIEFYSKNYNRWLSVFEIYSANMIYINNGRASNPQNSWQELFKLGYFTDENLNSASDCIVYKTPLKRMVDKTKTAKLRTLIRDDIAGELGILKVVQSFKGGSCKDTFYSNSPRTFTHILSLRVFFDDKERVNPFLKRKLDKNTLLLVVEYFDMKTMKVKYQSMVFKFHNLASHGIYKAMGKKHLPANSKIEKFSDSSVLNNGKGVYLFTLKTEGDRFNDQKINKKKKITINPYAKYPDFLQEKYVQCHKVGSNCESLSQYTCDSCPYGWFEVQGDKCTKGGNKFCGIDRCGEKDQPACRRGNVLSSRFEHAECQSGSLTGFCKQGLTAYCGNDKILICR